jgi:hypothetical protein
MCSSGSATAFGESLPISAHVDFRSTRQSIDKRPGMTID